MEALNLLRLWQPTATSTITTAMANDLNEEEDSFFELELTVASFDPSVSDPLCSKDKTHVLKQTDFLTPSKVESFSKRKVLPIDYSQSPVSHLKSAPKFGASMFRKSKSVSNRKTEQMEIAGNRGGFSSEYSSSGQSNSKRFTMIQKYFKLVTPLYDKVSKKQGSDKVKLAGELHVLSSPARKGSRRQQLGKSKSMSASTAAFRSPSRRDDSMVQQNDGIESAILHCNQSFNSCRGFSRSGSAHDKPSDSSRSPTEQTCHASVSLSSVYL